MGLFLLLQFSYAYTGFASVWRVINASEEQEKNYHVINV